MKPLYSTFLSLLFCFSTLLSSAQLFTSNQERVYGNERMINITFDTVSFDEDSIYYPRNHWFVGESSDCIYPDSASVLGKEVRVSPEGIYAFVLAPGDTLFLDTQLEFEDSVIVYTSSDGLSSVEATVSQVNEALIFDETGLEMVKTFDLQMIDDLGEPIDHPINDYYFETASESGLISFPILSHFPELSSFYVYDMSHQLNLQGFSSGPGIHDLTTFDVYDFQPGDEIHYEEGSSDFGEGDSFQYAMEYLDRTDYEDSIVYEIEITLYENGSLEPASVWVEDRTIERLPFLEIPAGSPIIMEYDNWEASGDVSFLQTHPDYGTGKVFNHLGPLYFFSLTSGCFNQVIDGTCFQNGQSSYYEGLGGPYFECINSPTSSSWSTLLYFNKGGEEWGSPLSVNNEIDPEKLTIYPNPATSDFNIRVEGNQRISSVRLYDLSGRVVREFGVNRSLLSLSGISSGIYGVEITFSSGASATKKLVVR